MLSAMLGWPVLLQRHDQQRRLLPMLGLFKGEARTEDIPGYAPWRLVRSSAVARTAISGVEAMSRYSGNHSKGNREIVTLHPTHDDHDDPEDRPVECLNHFGRTSQAPHVRLP